MKTAVSIPDAIFEAADLLAGRLGISRSELYARSLAKALSEEGEDSITQRLDALYVSEPSGLDPVLKAAQRRRLQSTEW